MTFFQSEGSWITMDNMTYRHIRTQPINKTPFLLQYLALPLEKNMQPCSATSMRTCLELN